MKLGAVYIRVSTDMQVELSPDSQLKMIKQYAAANDIIITKDYIYTDDGISGRKAEKRPAFMRMIATAKVKPRPFDVILVWKFSRFARNREDSIVYKSMLKKECGIDVISVSEPIGNDKTSILIEALLEAMDEYYSLNLSEEVKRGMTEKISRGGIVATPPFGYSIENGVYVPNDKAPIVKMIFEKYLAGSGTRAIATELNTLGIKTARGNTFGNRNISYILSNITYIGKLRWNPSGKATVSHNYVETDDTIIVDGKHEPIIDKELFDKVQKLLAQNAKKYPSHYQQGRTEYFFRGLVRCSNCGATLTQSQKGIRLQCHNYARGQCKVSHSICVSKLREVVIEELQNYINNSDKIKTIKFNTTTSQPLRGNDIILKQISSEESKLTRIKVAYEDGIDTLEEYKANKIKILQNIETLRSKLKIEDNSAKSDHGMVDEIRNKLVETLNIISDPKVNPEKFNNTLRQITQKIVFNRSKNEIEFYFNF